MEWLAFLTGIAAITVGWFFRRGGFRPSRVFPRRVPEDWDVYVFRASDRLMQQFDYMGGPAASPGRGKGHPLAQWYNGLGCQFLTMLPVVAAACGADTASAYSLLRHERRGPYLYRVSTDLTNALADEDKKEFVATLQESPAYAAWVPAARGLFRQRMDLSLDAMLLGQARMATKDGDGLYVWVGPRTPVASPRLRAFAEHLLRARGGES